MADMTTPSTSQMERPEFSVSAPITPKTNRPNLNKLYALPAPLRTFPLPTLVPHNPISLFHILYVWLSQTISPPNSHIEVPFLGWWSPETRSVHVTDSRSIRGLWEQGFYGKGSLSRSEPNWMNGQKVRKDNKGKVTSEEVTRQRRAARQQTKWERARKEREAIEQKLLEEAEEALATSVVTNGDSVLTEEEILSDCDSSVTISDGLEEISIERLKVSESSVGSRELLSLPNSTLKPDKFALKSLGPVNESKTTPLSSSIPAYSAPVGPTQLLALPNSAKDLYDRAVTAEDDEHKSQVTNGSLQVAAEELVASDLGRDGNGSARGPGHNNHAQSLEPCMNGQSKIAQGSLHGSAQNNGTLHTSNPIPNGSAMVNGIPCIPRVKRSKSVRFSPTVEKTTFIQDEPPSPEHATLIATTIEDEPEPEPLEIDIEEQEHFQLTLEEAFFLSYSLGVLTILDPVTKLSISNKQLFGIFRRSSHFFSPTTSSLVPDDPFMLNYVVYHHFRSLGWVVRGGVKFAVDFMLYNRGPVFSHAEFAVVILPSYSDPYWFSDSALQNHVKGKEKRTWAWFHCINRVITQVRKTLVLVYVDVPKPLDVAAEETIGIDGVLGRYKVREVVMQRWLSNRQRD